MSRHPDRREADPRPRTSGIFMPDLNVYDLPYISILWGAFNPELFTINKDKLLKLRSTHDLSYGHKKLLHRLEDANFNSAQKLFQEFPQWTDATVNLKKTLGVTDHPDLTAPLTGNDFVRVFSEQIKNIKGNNSILVGKQHSILYPAHLAIRENMADSANTRVGEIVFDQHIDTVVNPGVKDITSGNVYHYLTQMGLLGAVGLFGPDEGLKNRYYERGEQHKTPNVQIGGNAEIMGQMRTVVITSLLKRMRNAGITNITFAVDMDVLSPRDEAAAVRYSSITPYLGLGCQILPETTHMRDLESLDYLAYPTPQVRYLLQEGIIDQSQELSRVREYAKRDVDGVPMFPLSTLKTNIGDHEGLHLTDVINTIREIKRSMCGVGITDGVPLTTGGKYKGSIVEICGYEGRGKKTSTAAIQLYNAITA